MKPAHDVEIAGEVTRLHVERDTAGAVLVAYVNTTTGLSSPGGQVGRVWLRLPEAAADFVERQLGQPYTGWDVEAAILSDAQLATVKDRARELGRTPAEDRAGWASVAGKAMLDLPVLLADADACRWLLRQRREQYAALTVAALEAVAAAAAGDTEPLAPLREALKVQGQLPTDPTGPEAEPTPDVEGAARIDAGTSQSLADLLDQIAAGVADLVAADDRKVLVGVHGENAPASLSGPGTEVRPPG